MNWHTEHHMFAGVPCYKLKELHNEVAHDMPVPRTLMGAWTEMRTTWHRQQKEPTYEFDTPLPKTAKTGGQVLVMGDDDSRCVKDSVLDSIGGLAPKGL